MDWAALLQTASVAIAAATAVWGINSWRREFVGKKRIDLAEDVLARFYEVQDAVAYMRSPMGYVGEGSSREPHQNESSTEKEIYDRTFVIQKRYNERLEVFSNLRAMKYRFMAQFGRDAGQPFLELERIVNQLFVAARMLNHYWLQQGRRSWRSDEEFQSHLDQMHNNEAVFWDQFEDDDPIRPRLDAAVAKIERICLDVQPSKWNLSLPWSRKIE